MSDVKGMVDSAVAALKAGKKSEARTTLTQAVDLDPQNEQAWLYLSALVTSLEEQEICLENVLIINPSNERAQKALDIVLEKQGKPPRSAAPPLAPAPPPPLAPPVSTDSGWGSVNNSSGGWDDMNVANWDELVSSVTPSDISEPSPPSSPASTPTSPADDGNSDWLANIETNPWQTNDNDPVVSGGWDLQSDPDPISTSVDWASDSTVAAHGSGLNVEQPSDEEYDSWISGMNLGSGSSDSMPEPATNMSDFGNYDTSTSPARSSDEDIFDTSTWSDGWTTPGVDGATDDFFDSTPAGVVDNPFADDLSSSALDNLGGQTLRKKVGTSEFDSFLQGEQTSGPSNESDLNDLSFFDDEEDSAYAKAVDVDEDFLALDFIDEIEEATGARKMNISQYFAQIPKEIDVKIKSGGGKLGVVVLLLLNIAAVIGLVMQAG